MIEKILFYDKKLFLYLNNLGCEKYDKFWLFLSNGFYWIPFYLILLFYIYKKLRYKKFLLFLMFFFLFICISDLLSNYFKYYIKCLRPCKNINLNYKFRLLINCRGLYSFYSAHASNHMLIAKVFAYVFHPYQIIKYLLIIWAIFIGYSRIYLGVHFPIDILSGWFIGFYLSLFLIYIYKKIKLLD